MRNFHYTFETRKRSFISAFSIFMTVPIRYHSRKQIPLQDIIRINIFRKNIVAIRDYICECRGFNKIAVFYCVLPVLFCYNEEHFLMNKTYYKNCFVGGSRPEVFCK